jgi:hypothetical protein
MRGSMYIRRLSTQEAYRITRCFERIETSMAVNATRLIWGSFHNRERQNDTLTSPGPNKDRNVDREGARLHRINPPRAPLHRGRLQRGSRSRM